MKIKEESHLDVVLLGAHVQERLKKTSKRLEQILAWSEAATPEPTSSNVTNLLTEIQNMETLVNDLLRSTK